MKKHIIAAIAALTVISCRETVPPGNVGVIVSLSGGDKGVNEKTVGVGRYYLSWNEELHLFPTFTTTYNWTKSKTEGSPTDESISFQTKEGLVVNSDFGITINVNPDKVVVLFQKYRRNIEEIIDSILRNAVRDALMSEASKMSVEEVISEGKVGMLSRVTTTVKDGMKDNGIDVQKVFIIGEFRPPAAIVSAIESKIKATQDAIAVENQLRQTKAEAEKVVVAAEAQARANKLLSDSLTPNLINKQYIEKWNGVLPTYSSSTLPAFMVK